MATAVEQFDELNAPMTTTAILPVVPLDMLRTHEAGRIVDLIGPPHEIHRLEELGLREHTSICMVKSGSPCILAINNQRLSLRLDPATTILVEVTSQKLGAAS